MLILQTVMGNKMRYTVEYSEDALHDLEKIDWGTAERIRKKVRFFAAQKNPLRFCSPLTGLNNKYKWRVGKWRIVFEKKPKTFELTLLWILEVDNRDTIYKVR